MQLTEHQRAVLAHVVVDVDAWVAHAEAAVGEEAVRAKISRHELAYVEAAAVQGGAYKTRAQRDEAEA